jgi:hydrogenase nickel incorporation protein HypA/HybF
MHELPATQGLLEVALEAARQEGASRVHAIDLVVGDLTSFVDDSIQFYFDIISRDTPAEGAELRFRREPAEGQCGQCGHVFPVKPPVPRMCPECESLSLRVEGGQDFYVDSIEVDE